MATAATKTPAIYGAIQAIQRELPSLAKNGVGPQQQGGYAFLSVDDVIRALKPLLDSNNVIMIPEVEHSNVEKLHITEGRAPQIHTDVRVGYRFISSEDGSEVRSVVVAEGRDQQDKSIRKAMTSAQKIALIQTFFVDSGEGDLHDSENGSDNTAAQPKSAAATKVNGNASRKSPPKAAPAKAAPTGTQKELLDLVSEGKLTGQQVTAALGEVTDKPRDERTEEDFAAAKAVLLKAGTISE